MSVAPDRVDPVAHGVAGEAEYETVLRNALELHLDQEPFERARTELWLGRRRLAGLS